MFAYDGIAFGPIVVLGTFVVLGIAYLLYQEERALLEITEKETGEHGNLRALLHDPENQEKVAGWLMWFPIGGWKVGYERQLRNEKRLVNQAVGRGIIPESEWAPYSYDDHVRRALETIVKDNAYPANATFHPLDPFELMAVLRYGDLNEVAIMEDIEEAFGIQFSDELLQWLVQEKVTFIDFIHYIEENASKRPHSTRKSSRVCNHRLVR